MSMFVYFCFLSFVRFVDILPILLSITIEIAVEQDKKFWYFFINLYITISQAGEGNSSLVIEMEYVWMVICPYYVNT